MVPRIQSAINSLRGPVTPQTYTPSIATPLKPVSPARQHDMSYEWSRNHPASFRPPGGNKVLPWRPNLLRPPGGMTGQPVANPIVSPYGPAAGPIYNRGY